MQTTHYVWKYNMPDWKRRTVVYQGDFGKERVLRQQQEQVTKNEWTK